jgi:hypothetical protein
MTTIEKIARAVAGSPDAWYGNEHHHLRAAKAAVEAMMEPSDEMLIRSLSADKTITREAYLKACLGTSADRDSLQKSKMRRRYRAMLCAILNAAPETKNAACRRLRRQARRRERRR